MQTISFIYSIPYLIFFFYLYSLCFVEFGYINKHEKTTIPKSLVLVGLLLFIGLRGFIYTDWLSYYPFYAVVPSLWESDWVSFFTVGNSVYSGWEPGFLIYSILFKTLTSNYFVWVAINLIIDLIILNIFFKQYSPKRYVLAFVFFFAFSGLTMEVNLMRNTKAIMLFLISIEYLNNRKIVPYMILNAVGCLFHISSLLYLPLYFLLDKKWSKYMVFVVFILGNIVFLLQIEYIKPILLAISSLIGGKLELLLLYYLNSNIYSSSYGITIGYIERLITFCLIFYYQKQLVSQNKNSVIFINAFYVYIFIYLYLSEMSVILERLPVLFVFSYWILYPRLFDSVFKNKLIKAEFLLLLFVYISIKLISGNSTILSRYDNILFGIETYENRNSVVDEHIDEIYRK